MSIRETGRLAAVVDHLHGSDLAQDVASGATTVYVDSVDDFEEDGGTAELEQAGSTTDGFTYSGLVEGDNSLTGCSGITGTFTAYDARVNVVPHVATRDGHIVMDDNPDEVMIVPIHHSLKPIVVEGVREDDDQEAVELMQVDDDTWLLTDVLGQSPPDLINTVERSMYLSVADGNTDGGTMTTLGSGQDVMRVDALADAATQGHMWTFQFPSLAESTTLDISIIYAASSSSANDIRFRINYLQASASIIGAGTTDDWTSSGTAGNAPITETRTYTETLLPLPVFRLWVGRLGANAADTYGGTIYLVGVRLSWDETITPST